MGNVFGKPKPSARQINKLDELFEDLLRRASIDYSNREIRDMQAAVHTMLERMVAKVNERGIFKVSRIHPCGSMTEQTSLWKCDNMTGIIYTEFDCLAVLENILHETSFNTSGCKGCAMLLELPIDYKVLDKYYAGTVLSEISNFFVNSENFDILFVKEIDTSLRSLCSCAQGIMNERDKMATGCDLWFVNTSTGILRVSSSLSVVRDINNKGPEKCSLILHWTSKANSLVVSEPLLLSQLKTITAFPIYVDFLPTLGLFKQDIFPGEPITELPMMNLHGRDPTGELINQNLYEEDPRLELVDQLTGLTHDSVKRFVTEISVGGQVRTTSLILGDSSEHECFIVPKRCCICDRYNAWRKSGSLSEITLYIVNEMSEKHRKCYMITKYLLSIADRHLHDINSYHINTLAMNHSKKCSVASDSCAECVLEMLNELLSAYQNETLKSFSLDVNIFDKFTVYKTHCITIIERCIRVVNSVSEFASLETFIIQL